MTDSSTADAAAADSAERRITQRGLYFDELEEGVVYEHRPGRTMTETDNVLFTTLTMNAQPLHLDRHWSESTEFGEPLMNSMHTLATMTPSWLRARCSKVAMPCPGRDFDSRLPVTRVSQ